MSKRSLVLVLAALSIAPLPARASADTTARPDRPRVSGGIAGFDLDPNAARPGDHLGRIAQSLTRPRRLGGSGMTALQDPRTPTQQDSAGEVVEALRAYPYAAGDIDGDTKADLITREYGWDDNWLVGRSGLTGAALWHLGIVWPEQPLSASGYSLRWFVLDDTNADGTLDVIIVAFESAEPRPITAGRLSQTIDVYDGKTGLKRWGWSLDGFVTEFGGVGNAEARLYDDVLWNVAYVADVNGDGSIDPFVETCDTLSAEASPTRVGPGPQSGCTATHLDARTGAPVRSFAVPWLDPIPTVSPIGDIDGDGAGDLVIERAHDYYTDLDIVTASGANLWSTYADQSDYLYAFAADLSPAPGSDLVLFSFNWDMETFTSDGYLVRALNGANGDSRWGRIFPWDETIDFADDIDGDGGGDLRHTKVVDDTATTTAYEGARFRTALWSRTTLLHTPPGMSGFSYTGWLGDLTGDGVDDAAVLSGAYSYDEYVDLGALALDGRSGATLWQIPEGATIPYLVGGDVDSNGVPDLARDIETGSGRAVEVLDGLSLAPVWQTAPDADAGFIGVQAADITDAPGLELFAYVDLPRGNRVTAEASGARLWEITYIDENGPFA